MTVPANLGGAIVSSYVIDPEYTLAGLTYDKVSNPSGKLFAYEGFADSTAGTNGAYDYTTSLGSSVWYNGNQVTITHQPRGNPANTQVITIGISALAAHLAHGDLVGDWTTMAVYSPYNAVYRDFVTRHVGSQYTGTVVFLDGHAAQKPDITTDMVVYRRALPY